jgi:aspartyl protease family protein
VNLPISPDWQHIAVYAVLAAVGLTLVLRVPYVGALVRAMLSIGVLAGCFFILFQQAPYDPRLSRIASKLGLDRQQVSGREVRIKLGPDGHFWAHATVNGVKRRMLIDSGATVTVLSQDTARIAGVKSERGLVPVILQTANGATVAQTATVDEIKVGNITARQLKVMTSPALGKLDVLGMNFLSKLASWRAEEGTLVLVPHHPQNMGDQPPRTDQ